MNQQCLVREIKKLEKTKYLFFNEPIHQFKTDVNIKEQFVKPPITPNGSGMIIGAQGWKSAYECIAVKYITQSDSETFKWGGMPRVDKYFYSAGAVSTIDTVSIFF